MCGRYVTPSEAGLERLYNIGRRNGKQLMRRFNVAPTMEVPVLHHEAGMEGYTLSSARWSLVPHWWRQDKPPRYTHNARIEEAAGKPMWRDALKHTRCLIPAEGWYEWQAVERLDPATGEVKKAKQPHDLQAPDGLIVCFAGLMSTWQPPASEAVPEPEPVLTCAMLTTDAAPSVAMVHDRMPVVLSFDAYGGWLDLALQDAVQAVALARGHAQTEFHHHAVSQHLNSKVDDESLCQPLASEVD